MDCSDRLDAVLAVLALSARLTSPQGTGASRKGTSQGLSRPTGSPLVLFGLEASGWHVVGRAKDYDHPSHQSCNPCLSSVANVITLSGIVVFFFFCSDHPNKMTNRVRPLYNGLPCLAIEASGSTQRIARSFLVVLNRTRQL